MAKQKYTEKELERLVLKNRYINSEKGLRRVPVVQEENLLALVKQGKAEEIHITNFNTLSQNMGEGIQDPYKKIEYMTVSAISLITRAAIEGGMKADDAYDISDAALELLESAKTLDDMHDILETFAVTVTRGVQMAKRSQNDYLLERCKNYIARNIYDPLPLEKIAAYMGMNPSYLSRMFHQKAGITIREYIQKTKVEAACNFLKYGDRSIAQIALIVGYESQSSFTETFKKWMHCTPLAYRNAHKKVHLDTEDQKGEQN